MAKQEKEEVIFELKIEQNDLVSELEKAKKSIVTTKQEVKELETAYKKGDITLDEYIKDTTRLDQLLKKHTRTYGELTHQLQGTKSWTDKLKDSMKDASHNITIAGTNVGSLTQKIASFTNPATAAVAVVGALGAAYARSTIGAKDLAFAQTQLSEATTLLTNDFARLISSSEDGEGAITGLLNKTFEFIANRPFALGLKAIGVDLREIAEKSKELALIAEELEDLQRTEVELRSTANDRLADNQELLTDIQSEQTKYNDKIDKSNEIITNIRRNEEEIRGNLDEQLKAVTKKVESDEANEALLDAQLSIKKEISALEKDSERKVNAILRLQQNITEQNDKQLKIAIEKARIELLGAKAIAAASGLDLPSEVKDLTKPRDPTSEFETRKTESFIKDDTASKVAIQNEILISGAAQLNAAMDKLDKDRVKREKKNAQERIEIEEQVNVLKIQGAAMVFDAAIQLADEGSEAQLALALTAIGLDTAAALTGGIKAAQSVPYPGNILAMAQVYATILANVANAKKYITAAAGGGDFITTKPTLLMVGDNPGGRERVTVEPLSGKGTTSVNPYSGMVQMAGGGSLTSFNDGGLNVNTSVVETNQALVMANIIKAMPTPIVGVQQFNRVDRSLKTKQFAVRI